MAVGHFLCILVLLVIGHMFHSAETQQCPAFGSELSIYGWMLQRHIYKTMMADLGLHCLLVCRTDDRCQSFNFVMSLHMCEFSDRTKEARPEDFIPDPDRYYFRRDINRVPLGSVPEFPAETCKEIKASEGHADSDTYWLSTIIPGRSVLAYCDMKMEDVDECRGSSPVCDVNATCNNTIGSYRCTCNTGYHGDGKSCQDINECAQGSHDCLPSLANCTNTVGSYNCSCNPGYVGDGKTSCVESPDLECQNYTSLNSSDRKVTYGNFKFQCDNRLGPGWFRFEGAAGTRMVSSCPPINRCDTSETGWMNGSHPTEVEGKVYRQVCFRWKASCCQWSTTIRVKNCSSYLVYYLHGTPASSCHLRYCGSD